MQLAARMQLLVSGVQNTGPRYRASYRNIVKPYSLTSKEVGLGDGHLSLVDAHSHRLKQNWQTCQHN